MAVTITEDDVREKLKTRIDNVAHIEVEDTSGGCGASFDVVIVATAFEGKSRLQRHRLINEALKEEFKEIHALAIKKALTPTQWEAAMS